jgi:putative phosphonate metabolism protein
MSARYAVYFSPPSHSAWWSLGSRWLGRDEFTGEALTQAMYAHICPDDFHAITAEPRRYGFHATLKAPFRLVQGLDEAALLAHMQDLAKTLKPVTLAPMALANWDGFVALVPQLPSAELMALAAACVTELDDLRAPLTAAEIARRTPGLDARGLALLAQFGYPHVLERLRLHFTLTGRVVPTTQQWVETVLSAELDVLNIQSPLVLDRLCLFAEYQPGADFRRIADVQVGA